MPWRMTRSRIEEANRAQETFVLRWQRASHTARRRRRVITWNFWEMSMDIVPRIYKRSALTIRGTLRFLLVGMVRFGIHSLFTYIACGRSIRDNLLSLMARRTLAFCRSHGVVVDRSKWMRMFENENMVKKGKRRGCLCWKGRRCLCLEYEWIFS